MALTVVINGTNRASSVVFGSLRKTDNLNQQVDTLAFKVRKVEASDYVPVLGHPIAVANDDTTIFGGVIVRVTETVKAAKILEYDVECADYSHYLKRQIVTERYEESSVQSIIDDLVNNYTQDGFTTNNVVGDQIVKSISFNRLTVADCLQKLGDALSYSWYVDYDMDIHFFPKNTETGPALSDTSENYIYDSLEIVEDLTQIRNSVIVQGGEAVSDTPRTELFSGDGTRTTFALANKYDSLPTIEVGGSPVTVGVDFLDSDDDFDCLWNFNEKYIRFTAGNVPGSGTNNIEVTGTYLYPIIVSVPSQASQAEFGIYQFAITDKSIRSQAEAVSRAYAELQAYQNELYEGEFRTYIDGFRSGQVININSTQRSRNIDVLIQSVTAVMRDPLGNQFEYLVRFATMKSIGIIEYLQNQLRSKEVIVDDQETLLNFFPLIDTATASDDITVSTSDGPYKWGSFDWGYGAWNA